MTSEDFLSSGASSPDGKSLLFEGLQQLSVGISIYDDELRFVACSPGFPEIFELPAEMVRPGAELEPLLRLLAARGAYGDVDPAAFARGAITSLRRADQPFSFERVVANGRIFESQTSRLPSGGFITVHVDITHHKEARARLLESQRVLSEKTKELELILENASLGILTVVPLADGQRIMRRVNRALARLLGYAPGELEGMATRCLYSEEAEYERVTAGYFDVVCNGGTYQAEHVFARKDGGSMLGILRGSAIDPGDRSRGAIWLIEDITERKRVEAELAAKTALLETGTSNMPGAMVIWDRELRYLWWTPRAEHYFNLAPGTLKVGLPMETMARFFAERGDFGPGDIDEQIAMQMRPFYRREHMVIERYMPDGTVLEVRRNPLPEGGFVSVFQDITARKQMERELRLAKEEAEAGAARLRRRQAQVAALLDASGQGFLSFGANLVVDPECSQACLGMLGVSPVGQDIVGLLLPGDAGESLRRQLHSILNEPDPVDRAQRLGELPGDFVCGERQLEATFRLLGNGHVMLVLTDVTEERRFRSLSATDRLTGLANRRRLDEVLDYEHERANRTHEPLTLIIADIDHFKEVNDRFGHLAGDRVLIEVAGLLQAGVRKIDTVGRWGGEEFMILCPDTALAGGCELAEKLRSGIQSHAFAEVGARNCSFGVAQYSPGETIGSLVGRADSALYRAKQGGRNRVDAAVGDIVTEREA